MRSNTLMHQRMQTYLDIVQNDIRTKGVYWSIVHRVFKLTYGKHLLSPLVDFLKPDFIVTHGIKMFVDKKDQAVSLQLILTKIWEPFETQVFLRTVKKGDVVLDVGAHIGYYTLLAAQKVGVRGKVYAFEPDPRNFALLSKNVQANGYTNVVLINKAVSDIRRKGRLLVNAVNSGDNRVVTSAKSLSTIPIEMVRLDDFVPAKQVVNVIKMDIQGHEEHAVKGATRIIQNNPKLKILTEFWPAVVKENGGTPMNFLRFFTHRKFTLSKIDEKTRSVRKLNKKDFKTLAAYGGVDINLLCIRT